MSRLSEPDTSAWSRAPAWQTSATPSPVWITSASPDRSAARGRDSVLRAGLGGSRLAQCRRRPADAFRRIVGDAVRPIDGRVRRSRHARRRRTAKPTCRRSTTVATELGATIWTATASSSPRARCPLALALAARRTSGELVQPRRFRRRVEPGIPARGFGGQ